MRELPCVRFSPATGFSEARREYERAAPLTCARRGGPGGFPGHVHTPRARHDVQRSSRRVPRESGATSSAIATSEDSCLSSHAGAAVERPAPFSERRYLDGSVSLADLGHPWEQEYLPSHPVHD